MIGIKAAVPADDQPIGGDRPGSATAFGEVNRLTEYITPENPDIQNKYDQLTSTLSSIEDKIITCLRYVASYPYTQSVRVKSNVMGITRVRNDVWLLPAQAMHAPKLNCANRSFFLVSLLRQELPADQLWTVCGNLNVDHQDGHAWCMVRLDRDYILEPTNESVKTKLIPFEDTTMYEDIVYFNDNEVRVVPGKQIREPFSACFNCIPWLGDYLAKEFCL